MNDPMNIDRLLVLAREMLTIMEDAHTELCHLSLRDADDESDTLCTVIIATNKAHAEQLAALATALGDDTWGGKVNA